MMTGTNFTL